MPPSAPLSAMPPPIPVPAFLAQEPVHPSSNGERIPGAALPQPEIAVPEVKEIEPVVKLPEVKPGPGGIRRKAPGTGKRRITWVEDTNIAQIKEFEPSDSDDEDDEDGDEDSSHSCSCVIQ